MHYFESSFCAEWLKDNELYDSPEYVGIKDEDIAKFRVGNYDSATDDIKAKWNHVMLHCLPKVATNYTKWSIKESIAVRSVATVSDEALVCWFIMCYNMNATEEEMSDTEDETNNTQQVPKKKKQKKREGPHNSRSRMGDFMELLERIYKARVSTTTGKEWDDALMKEASIQAVKARTKKAGGSNTFTDAIADGEVVQRTVVKKYVMPYDSSTSEMQQLEMEEVTEYVPV